MDLIDNSVAMILYYFITAFFLLALAKKIFMPPKACRRRLFTGSS
jgi:hypothetical protein